MAKKTNNVRVLALGTGYVESASWSQWIVSHDRGFRTAEKALLSIKGAVLAYIEEEGGGDSTWGTVQNVIYEVIHGTLQDHGMLWEHMAVAGWNCTPTWGTLKNVERVLMVDSADKLISDPSGVVICDGIIERKFARCQD